MSAHVVIAGGSGLIGTALTDALVARGDRVTRLVRRPPAHPGEVQWQPEDGVLDPRALEGASAVVALNGASVGRMPWTAPYRRKLLSSRIAPTTTLVAALRDLGRGAPTLVSASAVGYYGSAPGRMLTESSPAGDTFLARVCIEWEGAARQAEDVTRVALARTAPVIHHRGVLRPLIALTSLGVGGPLGGGDQVWPWISLDDEVRALLHIIDQNLDGPVNLTGPASATANDIGRAIARELHRPFWLPAPAWALRSVLGAPAADSLLLADADVRPTALLDSGFRFVHDSADAAVAAAVAAR